MEAIPSAVIAAANAKSRRLRELVRAPEILVMPGAYDVLSALLFEQMGFKAIQGTTSKLNNPGTIDARIHPPGVNSYPACSAMSQI